MDDRYESEGRKPERERKVVHFIIQGHWRRRSLCSVFLICYCYCVGGKRTAVYQIYLIFLCVFWRWRQNVSVFHDRCVLISTCVCLSEGSAVLVRYRRSWILSESAAGGEDGALGQVPVHWYSLHMYVRRLHGETFTHGNLKGSKTWL